MKMTPSDLTLMHLGELFLPEDELFPDAILHEDWNNVVAGMPPERRQIVAELIRLLAYAMGGGIPRDDVKDGKIFALIRAMD